MGQCPVGAMSWVHCCSSASSWERGERTAARATSSTAPAPAQIKSCVAASTERVQWKNSATDCRFVRAGAFFAARQATFPHTIRGLCEWPMSCSESFAEMAKGHPAKLLQVTVIAASRETNDGLHAYFQDAGVASRTTRSLGDAAALSPATSAVVIFPDEFAAEEVVRRIAELRRTPSRLLVVVTSSPQRFRPALDPDRHSPLPIVLPKPAFGWTILDAIREHAGSERPC